MTRNIPKTQLDTWLMQLIQGDISQEDLVRLEGAMADDLEILDYCLEYLITTAGLEWLGREMENKGAEHLVQSLKKGRKITSRRSHSERRVLRFGARLAAVLVLGLGITYATLWVMRRPRQEGLAQIINGLSAKWENESLAATKGTMLPGGARYLTEGLVDMQLASGTRVVVKGPCWFSLTGKNTMRLDRGMITARVPEKALGFTVKTKTVSIVDFGTEFGVIAHTDGSVETHVFEGRVTLVPPGKDVASPESIPLPANIAATIIPNRPFNEAKKAGANQVRFVRDIPAGATGARAGRRFDLADVVGRGNGFGTGKIGRGIHPANGEALEQPVPAQPIATVPGYGFLLSWRYVNGVFVPDGSQTRTEVTSKKHLFTNCPDTNGQASLGITNGGFMALPKHRQASYAPRLENQQYGTAEKPALGMHPNAGITFDLDRIRADNPGVTLQAFQALVGISQNAPQFPGDEVTFWVLVDGEVRFRHTCSPTQLQTASANVALASSSQFLTLITTCAGNTDYAWAVWAEPFITLATSP